MHPLARYLVPAGIILVSAGFLWLVLGPIISYIAPFWPLLAIAASIGLLIWRLPLGQVQAIFAGIGNAVVIQPVQGILTALLLTAIYGGLLWSGYGYGAGELTNRFGFEPRWSWLLVTALGLPIIPAFWYLYQATGIPGDPKSIRRGVTIIMLFVIVFFAWWYHEQPNQLFDHLTGTPKFWVAEKEEAIYHSPGFSPVTGEGLRQGTPEDVARFKKKAWTARLAEKLEKSRREAAAAQRGVGMGLQEFCPGDEHWLEAGVERTFQIGERGGCNVRDIKIPTAGRVRVTWIYPGGEEEVMELRVGDSDLKLTRRPSAFRVLALEKAAFKAL